MSDQEQCRACETPATLPTDPTESIGLCTRHWNYWLVAYGPHTEVLPPCGAHLIKETE